MSDLNNSAKNYAILREKWEEAQRLAVKEDLTADSFINTSVELNEQNSLLPKDISNFITRNRDNSTFKKYISNEKLKQNDSYPKLVLQNNKIVDLFLDSYCEVCFALYYSEQLYARARALKDVLEKYNYEAYSRDIKIRVCLAAFYELKTTTELAYNRSVNKNCIDEVTKHYEKILQVYKQLGDELKEYRLKLSKQYKTCEEALKQSSIFLETARRLFKDSNSHLFNLKKNGIPDLSSEEDNFIRILNESSNIRNKAKDLLQHVRLEKPSKLLTMQLPTLKSLFGNKFAYREIDSDIPWEVIPLLPEPEVRFARRNCLKRKNKENTNDRSLQSNANMSENDINGPAEQSTTANNEQQKAQAESVLMANKERSNSFKKFKSKLSDIINVTRRGASADAALGSVMGVLSNVQKKVLDFTKCSNDEDNISLEYANSNGPFSNANFASYRNRLAMPQNRQTVGPSYGQSIMPNNYHQAQHLNQHIVQQMNQHAVQNLNQQGVQQKRVSFDFNDKFIEQGRSVESLADYDQQYNRLAGHYASGFNSVQGDASQNFAIQHNNSRERLVAHSEFVPASGGSFENNTSVRNYGDSMASANNFDQRKNLSRSQGIPLDQNYYQAQNTMGANGMSVQAVPASTLNYTGQCVNDVHRFAPSYNRVDVGQNYYKNNNQQYYTSPSPVVYNYNDLLNYSSFCTSGNNVRDSLQDFEAFSAKQRESGLLMPICSESMKSHVEKLACHNEKHGNSLEMNLIPQAYNTQFNRKVNQNL